MIFIKINNIKHMKIFSKHRLLFSLLGVMSSGMVLAQKSLYNDGGLYTASTDSTFIYTEYLYFGPNTVAEINGVYVVYSKNVWIAPTAQISGNGKIIIANPSTNPFYTGTAAGPTTIDGNNGNFINVTIENHNPSNIILADITAPVDGITNPTGPKAAALKIGKSLDLKVDGGDVILNGNDLVFGATAKINEYSASRMIVTSNSIAGHVIKENTTNGTFVFPVGIAEGDYTPATITGTNTYHVSVIDYTATNPTINYAVEGMNRTWHVYGGTATAVTLQHNSATNGTAYNDASAFITRYMGRGVWSTSSTNDYTANGIHTNRGTIGSGIPASATNDGSFLTKTSDAITPLPIKLISFNAVKNNAVVDLNWVTASEQNNTGFDVEKSEDGQLWTKIQFVETLAEGGNSNQILKYAITDSNPKAGKNFYRLKQIDANGTFEYSPIRMVQFDAVNKVDIYPNPAQNHININGLLGNEAINIYNVNGQQVATYDATNAKVQININHLVNGTYIIRITNQNGVTTLHKFIKE